ncbi:MAG: PIN domain-containing protein [Desulfobacterales bacterium]|nr:PIN domain-containing protein [Desulfobacterales bacterium]
MKDKFFIDTNIFVYSFAPEEKEKQRISKEIIREALSGNNGLISFQVIQEFINASVRKFARPLSYQDCEKYLEHVLAPLCTVFPSLSFYRKSLECMRSWKYSWYDSLIIAAAFKSKCGILYSEDFQHGQQLEDLKIINPFIEEGETP